MLVPGPVVVLSWGHDGTRDSGSTELRVWGTELGVWGTRGGCGD